MIQEGEFYLPFLHLPLPHPFLLASSEVNLASLEALLTSLEALSVSLEAICFVFIVFLFNNCIDHSLSVNLPFNGIISGSFNPLPEIFGFDFFKIKSTHFGKPSPSTRHSTVFLGVTAFVRV
jgi:hypothetical protein